MLTPSPALRTALARHRLVLGSQSASRQTLLRTLDLPFETLRAGIDEKAIRRASPEELVVALALAKAEAVKAQLSSSAGDRWRPTAAATQRPVLLISADQVVVHNDTILEKPESEVQARAWIASYAGAAVRTVGALAVSNLATGRTVCELDLAAVVFQPAGLPASSVDALVAAGEVFACAGGLMVEHELVSPHVARIEGGLDSVQGLGRELLLRLLALAVDLEEA